MNHDQPAPAPRALQRVLERNLGAFDVHRRLLALTIANAIMIVVAILALVWAVGRPVPPEYIPINAQGQILPDPALSDPAVSNATVGAFALNAIRAVDTYDYRSWRDQINSAAKDFSSSGWNSYLNSLEDSGTLKAVLARRMVVSETPTGAINYRQQGRTPQGVYAWRLTIPVRVRYDANVLLPSGAMDQGNTQTGTVTIVIARVPTTMNPSGLAVEIFEFTVTGT